MNKKDAEHELNASQRELNNLDALLQVMELAAEAEGSSVKIDWWGLIAVARKQLAIIPKHLEEVEIFLRNPPEHRKA